AEVFGYVCIHCAHFQPYVDAWKKKLPADVRYEYVPAAFGNPWDNFARAFYAAQMLGVQEKTHDAVFNAIFVDHSLAANASLEQIADAYGKFGVDRDKFFSTMRGYEVSAKLNTARQFAIAGAVDGTPTIIVAGKYRLKETTDRGAEGMLATVDFLIARERRKAGR
ncbi:MAG TPA: thiol:disulfide interchange protein DsbA/DsbL, partial [Arenimonas sp.]|uniref:thiol:disulfide interchange protein DsbA/DsbL n=1 Tax=Arenimonas sp. TaxID=1872635 RepID=UPI002C10BD60